MSNEFSLFDKLNKYLEDGNSSQEKVIIDDEFNDLDNSIDSIDTPKKNRPIRNMRKKNKKTVNDVICVLDDNLIVSPIITEDSFHVRTGKARLPRKAKKTSAVLRSGRRRSKKKSSEKHTIASVIEIDSSDSDEVLAVNTSLGNVSFDIDNYEISVKVIWKGKIDKFPLRKYQKFSDLIKILGEKENNQNILLNINNKIIQPDDTPDSIGYEITDFIHATVTNTTKLNIQHLNKIKDKDEIELKIQSELAKKHFIVHINKFKPMKSIVFQCSEEWKCDPSKIKLYFDGEIIDLNMLANDLELEGGEIIDCRVIN